MYKMLMFLKRSDDIKITEHFVNYTLKILSEFAGGKVSAAKVESNLLLDQKYELFCEVSLKSKDEWDKKSVSKEGRNLNKDLMNFHNFIDIIFVNYEEEK